METLWLPTGYGEISPEVPAVVSPRVPAAACDIAGETRSTGPICQAREPSVCVYLGWKSPRTEQADRGLEVDGEGRPHHPGTDVRHRNGLSL